MGSELQIGVWTDKEERVVYSRSSEKQVFPRTFVPKKGVDLSDVKELAGQLYSDSTMPRWTAQTEAQHLKTVKKMKEIATIR
jgi:hypothetical protein